MSKTIHKEVCCACHGSGHSRECACCGDIDFVMGCCKRCGGEGFVTVMVTSVSTPPEFFRAGSELMRRLAADADADALRRRP